MADDKKNAKQPKITRVKATDSKKAAVKKTTPKKTEVKAETPVAPTKRARRNPLAFIARAFSGLIGYFKGAWYELRQVRWPNRRATWSMTGALLGFTTFFIVLILFADILFENLFKLILK